MLLLCAGDDPRRQVAYVDRLGVAVGRLGSQYVAALRKPLGPVGEPAARVAGPDDQSGPDDQASRARAWTSCSQATLLEPYFSAVSCSTSSVIGGSSGQRLRGAARGGVVGVHADRGDEGPVRIGEVVERARPPSSAYARRRRRRPSCPRRPTSRVPAGRGTTCFAPSGTEPDSPRAAQVTSWPRATASHATARERNMVPPRTRIRIWSNLTAIRAFEASAVRGRRSPAYGSAGEEMVGGSTTGRIHRAGVTRSPGVVRDPALAGRAHLRQEPAQPVPVPE